jgi:cytochrome P450
MPSADQVALPELPINQPDFARNPFPGFAAAREVHPWLATSPAGYVITDYFAARDLLAMDDKLRTGEDGAIAAMGAADSGWGRWQKRHINNRPRATHTHLRDTLAPMFTPREANRHRGLMRAVINELLDEWAPRGRFDFEEFASYFPISVMCGVIGASTAELPRLRPCMEAMGLAFGLIPDLLPRLELGYETIETFSIDLVAARRADPRQRPEPDLLDVLLAATEQGELAEQDLIDSLIFFFAAGYDTSKNVLTLTMRQLLDRPEMYRRCAEDLAYCGKVVEESLRYASPATMFRITAEDLTYRDVTIPKDALLFVPVSVLGRDPRAAHDPDAFDPERTHEHRHMAFGRGMHICLGQFIARAQLEEGLHLIAQRLKDPRLAGEYGWRPFPGVWGMRGLPIEFTPAG